MSRPAGPAAERALGGRLLRSCRSALLARLAAWLCASAIAWSAGNAAFLLAGAPEAAAMGLLILLASLLPAFLAWPIPEESLRAALRVSDRDTTFEAWLEAPPGPARDLLELRAAARAVELELETPPRLKPFAGLKPLAASALAALALFELLALVAVGRPLLSYAPPPAAGRGSRIEEGGFARPGEADPASLSAPREGMEEAKAEGSPETQAASREAREAASEEERARALYESKEKALEEDLALGDAAQKSAEKRAGSGGSEGAGPEGQKAAAPMAKPAEGRGTERARGDRPAQAGFEAADESLAPSPLLDYRARFARVYAERTRDAVEASGELSLGRLRDYERRYFESFALSAGIAPREEAYAALLKRRWRELGGKP